MRIIFLGRRPHAVEALGWLLDEGHEIVRVVCPSGAGQEIPYWSPTVREFAESRGLCLSTSDRIHQDVVDPMYTEAFDDIDLVLSFLYWKRIKPPLLGLAKFGCINFHPAPLPDFKGLGGYNFAILEGHSTWGATAHYVDEGIDTGPIISVQRFPFDWRTETAFSLEHATRAHMLDLFKRTVREVDRTGLLPAFENVGGRYYSRAEMDGAKRIDLQAMSPEEIDLRVRAFWYPPFEGAYIEVGDERMTLVSQPILASLTSLHGAK